MSIPDLMLFGRSERTLEALTSHDVVASLYQRRHGRKLRAGDARSITAHVDQGLELIRASRAAPVSTRPLLLYYGIAALARALVMFGDRDVGEAQLIGRHGLETDFGRLAAREKPSGVLDVTASVTSGLFTQLAQLQPEHSFFHRPGAALQATTWMPDEGEPISLGDFLAHCPDCWSELEFSPDFEIPTFAVLVQVDPKGESLEEWTLDGHVPPEEVGELLYQGGQSTVSHGTGPDGEPRTTVVTARGAPVTMAQALLEDGPETILIDSPSAALDGVSPGLVYFSVGYLLSMLARYRLREWSALWRGERGDLARPAVARSMAVADRGFLEFVKDQFFWSEAGAFGEAEGTSTG